MQNETFAASAVKLASINTGAALSIAANTGTVGAVAGVLAATYSGIQIFKSLPWITEYVCAIRDGIRTRNWSRWRAIGRREEKASDDTK